MPSEFSRTIDGKSTPFSYAQDGSRHYVKCWAYGIDLSAPTKGAVMVAFENRVREIEGRPLLRPAKRR